MVIRIRESSVKFLANFGSKFIDHVKFRDSFVFLGQRGIEKGKAIEKVEHKGRKEFANAAFISGCAAFPRNLLDVQLLVSVFFFTDLMFVKSAPLLRSKQPNCT